MHQAISSEHRQATLLRDEGSTADWPGYLSTAPGNIFVYLDKRGPNFRRADMTRINRFGKKHVKSPVEATVQLPPAAT